MTKLGLFVIISIKCVWWVWDDKEIAKKTHEALYTYQENEIKDKKSHRFPRGALDLNFFTTNF